MCRFILDVHLGRLAKYLRMLGFDTRYDRDADDRMLLHVAATEERILLSKDRLLIQSAPPLPAYLVLARRPREQLDEVLDRFQIRGSFNPLTRCLECNEILISERKEAVMDKLPACVNASMHVFFSCPVCRKVFWQGSHFDRMKEFCELLRS